jgi:predicted outer membrane repeat protein
MLNAGSGGGESSPVITNVVFAGNSADFFGGAIYNFGINGTSSPVLTNVTFTGNTSDEGGAIYNNGRNGGTSSPVVTNTILWGNTATNSGDEIYNATATLTLAHTLIEGGLTGISENNGSSTTDGGDNLDADPLFADASAGDVRLTGGSPAIARGTFAPFETGGIAEGVTTDLAGDARRFGLFPDLGAYELSTIASTSDQITGATGLVGYVEPTCFGGLLLLRDGASGGASGDLTFTRTDTQPESPDLPANVAPVTWTVDASLSAAPTYDLVFDVSSLGGIGDFSALMLYKSDDGGATWNAVDTFSGARLVLDEDRALVAVQDLVGFSQFAIGSTDASNPLPVELARFEAQRSGTEAVTVQWQTLSETNNAGFEVQRAAASADGPVSTGESWQTIAHLSGAGTTDTPQSYRFEDTDLPYAADSLSYRLRQVDTGGTESFSEAITIARQVTEAELLPTYPNPARSQATVRFAVPNRQDVRIDLYDMLGRRIRTVVDTNAEGRTEAQLDVSSLASGTYFLRMQTEDGPVDTHRVTVVR